MSRAISFTYLQRTVPDGYEHTLQIYFLPAGKQSWEPLPTRQAVDNRVIAELKPGPGHYTIMSTIALRPLEAGHALLAYPLPGCRPTAEALASIEGRYERVSRLGATGGVVESDVTELRFGEIYWIHLSPEVVEEITPYLAPPQRAPDGTLDVVCRGGT